jgi:hypothetical protein
VSYNCSYQEDFERNESLTKPLKVVVKAQNTLSLLKTEEAWFIQGIAGKKSQVIFPYVKSLGSPHFFIQQNLPKIMVYKGFLK